MRFGPEKSALMHFSRARDKNTEPLKLDGREIRPVESSRFLGVHLDRKLNFGAHRIHLLAKLKAQRFALSKISAMTWGPSLLRSRDVYLAVIQSAMTYAASVFTTRENVLGGKKGRGTGLVTRLQTEQNKCLRVITGAYRSTPVKVLEAESNCMPIGIVLAQRAASFDAKATAESGKWAETWNRCQRLVENARGVRRRRRARPLAEPLQNWMDWTGDRTAKKAAKEEWSSLQEKEEVRRRRPHVGLPWTKAKRIWHSLKKHEASCLVQIRSGHIGLGQYLALRKVPDANPWCRCGIGDEVEVQETAAHIILDCEQEDREGLPLLRGR